MKEEKKNELNWWFNNYSLYILMNGFHKTFDNNYERIFQKIIDDSLFYEINFDFTLNINVEKWISTAENRSSFTNIHTGKIEDWIDLISILDKIK